MSLRERRIQARRNYRSNSVATDPLSSTPSQSNIHDTGAKRFGPDEAGWGKDVESEMAKFRTKEGLTTPASPKDGNLYDLYNFPNDDLKEVVRERLHRSKVPAVSIKIPKSKSDKASTPANHSQLHQVAASVALYQADWKGVDRQYRNSAMPYAGGQSVTNANSILSPPLFENGPNVVLPQMPSELEAEEDNESPENDDLESSEGSESSESSPSIPTGPASVAGGLADAAAAAGADDSATNVPSSANLSGAGAASGGSLRAKRAAAMARYHRPSASGTAPVAVAAAAGGATAPEPTTPKEPVIAFPDPPGPDPLCPDLLSPPDDEPDKISSAPSTPSIAKASAAKATATKETSPSKESGKGTDKHGLPVLPKVQRRDLFSSGLVALDDLPEPSIVSPPYAPKGGIRIIIEPKDLTFSLLGNPEPYFCTMALYDMNKKSRISENFYFERNPDHALAMIGATSAVNYSAQAKESQTFVRRGGSSVFTVPNRSSDIWVVIRIEKVLQGEPYDDVTEPYSKHESLKPKDAERFTASIAATCQRLGKFRQPFCWTMVPLFNDDKQVAAELSKITSLYRYKPDNITEAAMFEFMSEYGKTGSTKRHKTIPGRLVLEAAEWPGSLETKPRPVVDFDGRPVASWLVDAAFSDFDGTDPSLVRSSKDDGSSSSDSKSAKRRNSAPVLGKQQPIGPGGEPVLPVKDYVQEVAHIPEDVTPHTTIRNTLYIYPTSVNLSKTASSVVARNIAVSVQLMENDDPHAKPLHALHNRNLLPAMADTQFTSVSYHNKTPNFYDEFKMELPAVLTPHHNLMFTFYHVACKDVSKGDRSIAPGEEQGAEPSAVLTPVGHAFMQVLYKGRVHTDKEFTLPLLSHVAPNYLGAEASAANRNAVIDAKKVVFKFKLRLSSTLYTADKYVNSFFQEYRRPKQSKESLLQVVRGVVKAEAPTLIQFLPTILNLTFYVIVNAPATPTSDNSYASEIADECFVTMVELFHTLHSTDSADMNLLLTQYIDHVFATQPVATTSALFGRLASSWLTVIKRVLASASGSTPAPSTPAPSGEATTPASPTSPTFEFEKYHRFAGFFLKLIAKSMGVAVLYGRTNSKSKKKHDDDEDEDNATANALPSTNEPDDDRSQRFSTEYQRILRELVLLLGWEVHLRMKSLLGISKELLKKLAIFITDIFPVFDRGICLELSAAVLNHLVAYPDEILEFLRTMANYEHFAQLNFPIPLQLTATNIAKLDELFTKQHFLASAVLRITSPHGTPDKISRMKALTTLHLLFYKHDHDPRFKSEKIRRRLVQIYFPFLLQVVDNIDEYRKVDYEEQRAVCVAFMYIVKNIDPLVLKQWWKRDTLTRQAGFLQALNMVANMMEHVGEKIYAAKFAMGKDSQQTSLHTKALLESLYTDPNMARGRLLNLREQRIAAARHQRQAQTGSISLGKATQKWKHTFGGGEEPSGPRYDETREACLSQELSYISLDILRLFMKEKEPELAQPHQPNILMDAGFSLIITLMQRRSSIPFQLEILRLLREFVHRYPKQLFTFNTTYCALLTSQLLSFCNFQNIHVRVESSALLFLLMKRNFETSSSTAKKRNFTRVKVQTIIALSKLVGQGRIKDTAYLKRALESLEKYGAQYTEPLLTTQVGQMSQRLKTILEDSVKINQHLGDPEMLADLYHRIAASYRNAPDLRVTWLDSLAAIHSRQSGNALFQHPSGGDKVSSAAQTNGGTSAAGSVSMGAWAEAAQCFIHIAALIAEYLNLLEPQDGLPQGCAAFESVCPSALEEQGMVQDSAGGASMEDDADGVSESSLFSETTLVKVIEQAVVYLVKGQLYEAANDLLKILLPIHEKNMDYQRLSKTHHEIHQNYERIFDSIRNQTRTLGSYYRVYLLGKQFGDLNGSEYIYKEPKLTRLGEICDRLQTLYSRKFNGTPVELWTKSGDIDPTKVDANKCYLQITSVMPYFDEWELKDRKTEFLRNYNISAFIFETPFTKGTKAHAENLAEQYKRKTILSVDSSFPYMKKRMKVVDKRTLELSPIENALELIRKRIETIKQELQHPSAKTLQPVLQGSVRLQVHAGPTEICKTFLGPKEVSKFDAGAVTKLRMALQEFLDTCAEALAKNEEIIETAQISFHQELADGYRQVKETMEPMLQE